MVRPVLFLCAMLGAFPTLAMAQSGTATFKAGLTIGGAATSAPSRTYTWGAAAVSVQKAGFDNTQRAEKTDTLYWFTAERAGGSFRIAVSISSGAVVKVIPV
jgi:hypothetical protein